MKKELLKPEHEEREKYSEQEYNEILDEQGTVNIAGMDFYPSDILKQCDPIAYRCGLSDIQEYEDIYICPVCGEEHEDEDAALYCCQEEEEEEEEEK